MPGCQETLIPTPYVMYGDAGRAVFQQTPIGLRSAELPVCYVTDRKDESENGSSPRYGYKRSPRLDFGVATCSLGDVRWDQLVADSVGADRSRTYYPKVNAIERTGSISPIASNADVIDGRITVGTKLLEQFAAEQSEFRRTLDRWLSDAIRKEAVVFVHGFNNTFDDAVIRLAQAWHFSGRQGVPVVFTWPAGSPGLAGYAYDRESGEYANLHLKLLLVMLATHPRIERVHLISHSRGTDVATTALRELNAELRAGLGKSFACSTLGLDRCPAEPPDPRLPYEILKLDTLVLAAPDLDLDVFSQRFVGDNVLNAARRTVIYFSEKDSALGWADWLFSSRRRVGNTRVSDLTDEARESVSRLTVAQLINCNVSGGSSHSYVMQHPAALSDLILLIRDGASPGKANGRPLKPAQSGFWDLDNDYLRPSARGSE